jgi:hypothetical protein
MILRALAILLGAIILLVLISEPEKLPEPRPGEMRWTQQPGEIEVRIVGPVRLQECGP